MRNNGPQLKIEVIFYRWQNWVRIEVAKSNLLVVKWTQNDWIWTIHSIEYIHTTTWCRKSDKRHRLDPGGRINITWTPFICVVKLKYLECNAIHYSILYSFQQCTRCDLYIVVAYIDANWLEQSNHFYKKGTSIEESYHTIIILPIT